MDKTNMKAMNSTTIDEYKSGILYENFIHNAHKSWANGKDYLKEMENLILKENGNEIVSHLPSAEKLLAVVKKRIEKAIDALLKRKFSEEQKEKLRELKDSTEKSTNSAMLLDIITIITEGFEITQK
jgi:hypothetical protein